jgi:hypothetical protein
MIQRWVAEHASAPPSSPRMECAGNRAWMISTTRASAWRSISVTRLMGLDLALIVRAAPRRARRSAPARRAASTATSRNAGVMAEGGYHAD